MHTFVFIGMMVVGLLRPDPIKTKALEVLITKCNVCHRRQNPGKVFTEANMDKLGPKVYEQVFLRRRMPRGNTVRLTDADRKALLNWLGTIEGAGTKENID